MTDTDVLLVENANASRVSAGLAEAISVLSEAGFDIDLRRPETPDEMDGLIRREAGGEKRVVIAGGDGTIHAALPALLDRQCGFGILPLGTANDLALTLGIPSDPAAAARVLIDGHRRRIDLGVVNGVPFVNVASVGLAVHITRRLKDERKRQWGRLGYLLTALETLPEAEPFEATIHCDGRSHALNAHQITVGNGVHYGGGMTVAADAAIDDGALDVFVLETASIPSLLAIAPALRNGRLVDEADVRTFRCSRLRIETDPAIMVSTDGEIAASTPAEFETLRSALEVFAPLP